MKQAGVIAICISILTASTLLAENKASGVEAANARDGHPQTKIMAGYSLRPVARGSDELENPSGIITRFGYLNDFPPQRVEATKTEPDENTYVVLDHNPGGPAVGFDYGRHFLFQGHELFGSDKAYITRINLDITDPKHRITLLTPLGKDGKTHLNSLDGSTWNPHTRTLLFTEEAGAEGGVVELGASWRAPRKTLHGIMGRAGYEGIHPDGQGNILLIEDTGGVKVSVNPSDSSSPAAARVPNSFVYRFVPNNPANLQQGGKLQALQVSVDGKPVRFVPVDATHPTGDAFSTDQLKLHTPGTSYPCRWITIHDTDVDGADEFDANAAAKSAGATPFKRPENGQFLPGSGFKTFFFDATGDTSTDSGNQPALAQRGAWGSIFRLDFPREGKPGALSIFVLGDKNHAAFDNVAFLDEHTLLVAEDRGDAFHTQLNMLDSVWAYDIRAAHPQGVRFIALGRDTSSQKDANFLDHGADGFQNEGDNEPTGLHFSSGDDSVEGMQGVTPDGLARGFITQQHGDNRLYEIVKE